MNGVLDCPPGGWLDVGHRDLGGGAGGSSLDGEGGAGVVDAVVAAG